MLLCDEPTGALDYKTGKSILKLLQDMARNEKMTVLIITHNTKILHSLKVDYVHVLVNGKIVKTGSQELAREIEENGYAQYK